MKVKSTNRIIAITLALFLCIVAVLSMSACSGSSSQITSEPTTIAVSTPATIDELDVVWNDARYKVDTALGTGEHRFQFEVKVGDNAVTFTINTDETTVGEALLNLGLVAGDVGDYGLYVKTVNGILADYDVNERYWAFYENGELAVNGVDRTKIVDGAHYEMVYTK